MDISSNSEECVRTVEGGVKQLETNRNRAEIIKTHTAGNGGTYVFYFLLEKHLGFF